jgi:hypothetical protein
MGAVLGRVSSKDRRGSQPDRRFHRRQAAPQGMDGFVLHLQSVAGNWATARLVRDVAHATSTASVQRQEVVVPKEPPSAIRFDVPGMTTREFSPLEMEILSAWRIAYETPHSPAQTLMIQISQEVQTVANLVRRAVTGYSAGRMLVLDDLAKLGGYYGAGDLESAILEEIPGIALGVGLSGIGLAAQVTLGALVSVGADIALGASGPSITRTARQAALGVVDSSVPKSNSFDALLKVMDALNEAHRRSREHTLLRDLNDVRLDIHLRRSPIDTDERLRQKATRVITELRLDPVPSRLRDLLKAVQDGRVEIQFASKWSAFSDYERIWMVLLDHYPRLRRALSGGLNPQSGIRFRLQRVTGVRHDDPFAYELVPLAEWPEAAAEYYQIVFGMVPVR